MEAVKIQSCPGKTPKVGGARVRTGTVGRLVESFEQAAERRGGQPPHSRRIGELGENAASPVTVYDVTGKETCSVASRSPCSAAVCGSPVVGACAPFDAAVEQRTKRWGQHHNYSNVQLQPSYVDLCTASVGDSCPKLAKLNTPSHATELQGGDALVGGDSNPAGSWTTGSRKSLDDMPSLTIASSSISNSEAGDAAISPRTPLAASSVAGNRNSGLGRSNLLYTSGSQLPGPSELACSASSDADQSDAGHSSAVQLARSFHNGDSDGSSEVRINYADYRRLLTAATRAVETSAAAQQQHSPGPCSVLPAPPQPVYDAGATAAAHVFGHGHGVIAAAAADPSMAVPMYGFTTAELPMVNPMSEHGLLFDDIPEVVKPWKVQQQPGGGDRQPAALKPSPVWQLDGDDSKVGCSWGCGLQRLLHKKSPASWRDVTTRSA